MGNAVGGVLRDIARQCDNESAPEGQAIIKANKFKMWPFNAQVPRPFIEGDVVTLKGKVADDAESFTVALVCDEPESDDNSDHINILYHYKAEFGENKTVIKCKSEGTWCNETEIDNGQIQPGSDFEMKICLLADEGIRVYFGNNYHSTFPKHDMHSYEDITSIQIREGLDKIISMTVEFADG